MDPLELLNLPMGLVNYYYFQAWNRNEELAKEQKKEEERRKAEEKQQKGKSGKNTRIHPAQGGRPFLTNPAMLEELQDEFE